MGSRTSRTRRNEKSRKHVRGVRSHRSLHFETLEHRRLLDAGDALWSNYGFDPINDDSFLATEVQPDNRIVAAGQISAGENPELFVARFLPDGTRDNSFGINGLVRDLGIVGFGSDLGFQSDGKIVIVVPRSGTELLRVVRLNIDGTLDSSFGDTGVKQVQWPEVANSSMGAVLVQPNDQIVIATSTYVMRFDSDGSIDGSFGNDGLQVVSGVDGYTTSINDITLDGQGRIILAGSSWNSNVVFSDGFFAARLTPQGQLDPSFDGDGKFRYRHTGISDSAKDVVIQGDGRILIGGNIYSPSGRNDSLVIRLMPDGSFDSSFDFDGKLVVDHDGITSLVLQPDGKIVAVGYYHYYRQYYYSYWHPILTRYHSDGSLDGAFGDNGSTIANEASFRDAAILSNGNIVIVGDQSNGSNLDALVWAFEGDSPVPLAPLVVNIATHGWRSSGAEWAPYGDVLNAIPAPGSLLDGRVTTYVSDWDSNTGFTSAAANWAIAAGLAASGYPLMAQIAISIAQTSQRIASDYAHQAADLIVREVIEQHLLAPAESNNLQKIQLIGHSRGAAVNARVSKLLQDRGYQNVVTYVSLDGFSTDWPLVGFMGDISITNNATVGPGGEKLNFRVEVGLAGIFLGRVDNHFSHLMMAAKFQNARKLHAVFS